MVEGYPEQLKELAFLDRAGRTAMQLGDIQPFGEFSPRFDRRFSVFALPDEQSLEVIQQKIIVPLEQIARPLGIDFLLSGRDIQTHITIQEGELPEGLEGKKKQTFEELIESQSVQDVAEQLKGKQILFKYVLLGASDKGTQSNIVLASDTIPPYLQQTRVLLSETYGEAGVPPLPLNILHTTLGRMNELPENLDHEVRKKYLQGLIDLRHHIAKNPLTVTIGNVYVGPSMDFIKQKPDTVNS